MGVHKVRVVTGLLERILVAFKSRKVYSACLDKASRVGLTGLGDRRPLEAWRRFAFNELEKWSEEWATWKLEEGGVGYC